MVPFWPSLSLPPSQATKPKNYELAPAQDSPQSARPHAPAGQVTQPHSATAAGQPSAIRIPEREITQVKRQCFKDYLLLKRFVNSEAGISDYGIRNHLNHTVTIIHNIGRGGGCTC